MEDFDFTLPGYTRLIRALLHLGYSPTKYADVVADKLHLVLRHDIDMDLNRAILMADHERDLGVQSHYYVLLRSDMYNPLSSHGSAQIRQLSKTGHQVGLHFDGSLYAQNRDALEAAAERECRILEDILGEAVETITFHRPSLELQGLKGLFAGRLHGYDPRFFSDIAYCSDSEGRWRFGHPLEHAAIKTGRAMQLVTHPVWWCAPANERVVPKLERLLLDKTMHLQQEMAANCKPFKAHLAAPEIQSSFRR